MDSFIIFLGGFDCQEKGEEARGAGVPVMPPPSGKAWGGVRNFIAFYTEKFPNFYLLRQRRITENLFFGISSV